MKECRYLYFIFYLQTRVKSWRVVKGFLDTKEMLIYFTETNYSFPVFKQKKNTLISYKWLKWDKLKVRRNFLIKNTTLHYYL